MSYLGEDERRGAPGEGTIRAGGMGSCVKMMFREMREIDVIHPRGTRRTMVGGVGKVGWGRPREGLWVR